MATKPTAARGKTTRIGKLKKLLTKVKKSPMSKGATDSAKKLKIEQTFAKMKKLKPSGRLNLDDVKEFQRRPNKIINSKKVLRRNFKKKS